ncbi:MAG TPA: TrkA C-terminal domain-containing protein [Sedimentisphaerales bacterium]|nr:TrkA C-terminal domain-containing protein [Sedimentisphaerales bacterium]
MNLLLFIIVLIVSFIVVRIGAIAFQLTGLEWSLAKFQALSCFTATGFTTREAELITSDPRRRRIASVLIVLGHAGFVTMIATFANTIRPRATKLSIPFVPAYVPPGLQPWINLIIIVAAIYIIYKVFTNTKMARRLTDALRKRIIKKEVIKSVSCEELTVATGGYGVSKIKIREDNPILGKALSESELRKDDITVLAIVRADKTIPNPVSENKILSGDELICFGKLDIIRKRLA